MNFPDYVKRFSQNYSKLKHSYTTVKRTLTKGKRF